METLRHWTSSRKLITAVSLVYNKRDLAEPAIESVLANHGMPEDTIEYVLWDNGSPDRSVAWYLEGLKQRKNPILRIEGGGFNIGVGAALNRVMEMTDSEYIFKFDDDCELMPMTLPVLVMAHMLATKAKYPLGVLSADVIGVGKAMGLIRAVELFPGITFEEAPCVGGGAVLISRKVLEDVGPWREDRLYGVEDADFAAKCWNKGYRNAYLRGAFHISNCRGPKADARYDEWKLAYHGEQTDKSFNDW